MASKQSTVDFILHQIKSAGEIHTRKMFGEYGIYCDGKIVALVCDDQLFVKPTKSGLKFIGNPVESSPYPGAKPYFLIDRKRWDDGTWLADLINVSSADLPIPKKS